jgi:hypothetical protein
MPKSVATAEAPPDTGDPAEGRHRLTALQGLAALSLDAMASVAYGPEAIVLVLAAAGAHGLGFTLPPTSGSGCCRTSAAASSPTPYGGILTP